MISSLTSPDFIGLLVDNKTVLVLENCENYIAERTADNRIDMVTTILNIADGILSDILECQFIAPLTRTFPKSTMRYCVKDLDCRIQIQRIGSG